MTKTVVPNHQVAHLWAQQNQSGARSGNGNYWFDGGVLFSYRTPIANIITDKNGAKVALLDNRTYSITTTQHQSNASGALGYGANKIMDSYTVPYIGRGGGQSPEYLKEDGERPYMYDSRDYSKPTRDPAIFHPANVRHFVESFRGDLKSYMRARDEWRRDHSLKNASEAEDTIREYVERFGLTVELPDFAAEIAAARAARAAKEAKDNTPEQVEKRRKSAEQRLERTRRDFRELRGIYGEDWREGWRGRSDSIFTESDYAARDAAKAAAGADRLSQWRAGANVRLPHSSGLGGREGALLRIVGKRIQTSEGAEFPVEHGRRAFPIIARIRRLGRGWQANGEQIPLGSFRINTVAPNGDVTAGCHFVKWEEIHAMAVQLGIAEPEESDPCDTLDRSHDGVA